jgi:hypothetical protein
MPGQLTIPADPHQTVLGYLVNSSPSEKLYKTIHKIQTKLEKRFPGAIWIAPKDSLHITLIDWLAPLVDYGQDKDELFRSIKDDYTKVLAEILQHQAPIQVAFDTLEVHPTAIIVKGHDDGSYQRIRERFLENVELLPGTKPPPKIIHTTMCKFLEQIDVDEVANFLRNESLYIEEQVAEFRLARETQIFMLEHDILKRFSLH